MSETGTETNSGAEQESFRLGLDGKDVVLPKKIGEMDLQDVISRVIGRSKSDARKEVESKYKGLKEEVQSKSMTLEELQQRLQQLEDEKLGENERIKRDSQREVEKLAKVIKDKEAEAGKYQSLFKKTRIENDLLSALSKHNLANPSQTSLLIQTIGQPDIIPDEKDVYKTVMRFYDGKETIELSPGDFVDKFLAMPENAHHLKSSLKPGGGTVNSTGSSGSVSLVYRAEAMRDPAVRQEYSKRLAAGEKVRIEQ